MFVIELIKSKKNVILKRQVCPLMSVFIFLEKQI